MKIISPARALGAFYGLAIGDAYGRPLEFVRGPQVRTLPVSVQPGAFRWTDDTHMALYLARAMLDVGSQFNEETFGRAVAERFVEWSLDPLTPSTAPGNTCLAGVRSYRDRGDWRTSGVEESDGCGAVMRICPLPMVWRGEELDRAARAQAVVTHRHPNALEAAVTASQILRAILEGEPLTPSLVLRFAAAAAARGPQAGLVATALDEAVTEAQAGGEWLGEGAIATYDGGWRSISALGLALAAALRWREHPTTAIDRAARIDGDSDSVACLAGMFLGAHHGVAIWPEGWRAAVPGREEIEALVERLLDPAREIEPSPAPPAQREPAAAAPRTSLSDPIRVDWVLEGVGQGGGRLGLTFAPGKKAPSAYGAPWARELGLDLDHLRAMHRVDVLISLVEDGELESLEIPALITEANRRGVAVLRSPIADQAAPTWDQATFLVDTALALAQAGQRVVFHCRGGIGRAGTLAACALVRSGSSPEGAIAEVRRHRPSAVETGPQEDFVHRFARGAG